MKLFIVVSIIISLLIPSKVALHMFQQNRYELNRYTMWAKEAMVYEKANILKEFLLVISAFILAFFMGNLLGVIIILYFTFKRIVNESEKNYIKPLVYTFRVYRQIIVLSLLYLLLIIVAYSFNESILMYLLFVSVFLPYLMIYPMHLLTHPLEQFVKYLYKKAALKKLDQHTNLIKIGITGSYGKTSSKNILQEILSEEFYSLPTPASFNTPMGITITIRQDLKNIHQVFIVEMGADKVGEIVELSDFIRPQIAIITSIGPQHLATFKSIENIIHEKMSLVEKLPADGLAIINKDNQYINNYQIKNNCQVISYGIKNLEADYLAQNITYNINGSVFDVKYKDEIYQFNTRLLGEHNVLNILSGIAVGRHLGLSWEKLITGVGKISYVPHRLELKTINGLRFIDNAFNSNPEGAQMSLKVISQMPNRRFIVTPGMIDLGVIQEEENYKFGFSMRDQVDVAILVGQNQTLPIVKGLKDSGFDQDKILVFDTVKEALAYVYQQAKSDDIILLENDLPDAFSN